MRHHSQEIIERMADNKELQKCMSRNLKHYMKVNKIPQKWLSLELNISMTYVCYIINGQRKPSEGLAMRICEAIGMTMEQYKNKNIES